MTTSPQSEPIQVLEGLDVVRRRPALFLGDLSSPDIPNRLLQELMCCTRDAAIRGHCGHLDIHLLSGGQAVLRDDGLTLPLARDATGRTLAEVYLTVLFACHGAKPREHAESLCKTGIAVVNALARKLTLRVAADGTEWRQEYAEGQRLSDLVPAARSDERWTELSIELDSSVLPRVEFDFESLAEWVSREVTSLQVRIADRRDGREATFPRVEPMQPEGFVKVSREVDRFRAGALVEGRVLVRRPFGLFVDLGAGVHGLIRIVDLTDDPPIAPADIPAEGTTVTCVVLSTEPTATGLQVALSMKKSLLRSARERQA